MHTDKTQNFNHPTLQQNRLLIPPSSIFHQRQHSTHEINYKPTQNNQLGSPKSFQIRNSLGSRPAFIPSAQIHINHCRTPPPQNCNTVRVSNQRGEIQNPLSFNNFIPNNKFQNIPSSLTHRQRVPRKHSEIINPNSIYSPCENRNIQGQQNYLGHNLNLNSESSNDENRSARSNNQEQIINPRRAPTYKSMIMPQHQYTSANLFPPNNSSFNITNPPNKVASCYEKIQSQKDLLQNNNNNNHQKRMNQSAMFEQTGKFKPHFKPNFNPNWKQNQINHKKSQEEDMAHLSDVNALGPQKQQQQLWKSKQAISYLSPQSYNTNTENPHKFPKNSPFTPPCRNTYQSLKINQDYKFHSHNLNKNSSNTQTPIDSNNNIKIEKDSNSQFKKGRGPYTTIFTSETKNAQSRILYENTQPLQTTKQQSQTKKIQFSDFQVIEKLGKGGFGDVFLVQEKLTKFLCVLKVISKTRVKQQKLQEHITRQIKIQSYLHHLHLVSIYGFFDDKQKIYLIMEYLHDGPLSDCRKKISQPQTAYLIRQLCQGLSYMHCQKIIHRDIKPENIFMFEDHLKIGDFGCSVFTSSLRTTTVGCIAYISPQQLNHDAYDDKIDVWSVGILAYELLLGKPPFQEDLKKMVKAEYRNTLTNDSQSTEPVQNQLILKFPDNSNISETATQFIKSLLQSDPENRLNIKQAIKHQFLKKSVQWQTILRERLDSI